MVVVKDCSADVMDLMTLGILIDSAYWFIGFGLEYC